MKLLSVESFGRTCTVNPQAILHVRELDERECHERAMHAPMCMVVLNGDEIVWSNETCASFSARWADALGYEAADVVAK